MNVSTKRELVAADLTREIIGAFFEVYNTLGTGFVEAVYSAALAREMRLRGLTVDREVPVEIVYKDAVVITQRLDFVVHNNIKAGTARSAVSGISDASENMNSSLRP